MVRLVCEVRPLVVFHLASQFVAVHGSGDLESLITSNVLFGTQLLEGMEAAGCTRLVNAGTCWQHFKDAEYEPVNLYAATKQAMQDVIDYWVSARSLDVVTLEIFDTYGPGDTRNKVLPLLVRAALDGAHLDLSPGDQRLELVYVDDAVDAFVTAGARLAAGGASGHERYALQAAERLSLRRIAALVERVGGRPIDAAWGARPYRDREVMEPWRLGETLPGWTPRVPLEEGIRRVIAAELTSHDRRMGAEGGV
jgi:nucleoside-diphosphate-sugar epimerase